MIDFSAIKLGDCLGFPRFKYLVPRLDHSLVELFEEFGTVTIFDFNKPLIKVKSKRVEISGIYESCEFIITFKERFENQIKESFDSKLHNFEYTKGSK